MRTTVGQALLDSINSDTLQELATGARNRAAILRETTNANRQMDADRFDKFADAIEGLGEE